MYNITMPSGIYKRIKPAWNKGIKWIEMSGKNHPMWGKTHTLEVKEKIRLAHLGKKNYKHSEETKKKIGLSNSISLKNKKRLDLSGEKHWNWKGGITSENESIRKSIEYKEWRKSVFERDDYTCQECSKKGTELHADHIKPFAYYPEIRLKIENGRTLCKKCHLKTDTYSNRLLKQIQYV